MILNIVISPCLLVGELIKHWGRVPFLPGQSPPPAMVSSVCQCVWNTKPGGYEIFFMLSSAELEIFSC